MSSADETGSGVMWRAAAPGALSASEEQWRGQPYALDVPGAALREASSVADLGLFYSIGEAWAQIAIHFAPRTAPSILDIGCGCGKMARFFIMNPRVRYVGLDVYRPAISWCTAAFAAWPRFEFRHRDVRSALYNPSGQMQAEKAVLPVASGSVDIAICGSLFTHLLEPAFRRYIAELRRVLARPLLPGSRRRGRAIVSIHVDPADGRFSGSETRIDISRGLFAEIVEASGLRVVRQIGNVFGQHVYVLERRWRGPTTEVQTL